MKKTRAGFNRINFKSFSSRTSQETATEMKFTYPLQITTVLALVLCEVATQQCGSEYSIMGMMLQRHTFKEMITSIATHCLEACNYDVICQSFNYVISQSKCELNNRTKEARPGYFRPDPDRYYYGLVKNRGNIERQYIGMPIFFLFCFDFCFVVVVVFLLLFFVLYFHIFLCYHLSLGGLHQVGART